MKKFMPHIISLTILLGIFIYSQLFVATEMSYWDFLGNQYVLNIGVAGLGIVIGYGIRNFYVIIGGASFALVIYCLAFSFDSKGIFGAFFLAIYTVFLGFAIIANMARHFKDWLLSKDSSY